VPLYEYICGVCKGISERLQAINEDAPECCGVSMRKLPTSHAMVIMKGMGGFPSLRKVVQRGPKYHEDGKPKPWTN